MTIKSISDKGELRIQASPKKDLIMYAVYKDLLKTTSPA